MSQGRVRAAILNKIYEWGLSSSSHGIPRAFRTRYIYIRIMWIVVFIVSCSYCSYVIIKSIVQYQKYETTVSIKKVQELPQLLPAITICNLNAYNYDVQKNYGYVIINALTYPECMRLFRLCLRTKWFYPTIFESDESRETYCQKQKQLLAYCFEMKNYAPFRLKSLIANMLKEDIVEEDEIGRDLGPSTLFICSYNGITCSQKNFTRFWNNKYGFCYTFNSGTGDQSIFRSSDKGVNSGLALQMFIKKNTEDAVEMNSGLYVVVHNQSAAPFTLNNGITLPTGNHIYVGIDRVFNQKQPSPYSDCIDELTSDNPYAQRLFGFFRDLNVNYYDQSLCFNLCYQDKLIDTCGCSNVFTPAIRNTSYCSTADHVHCINTFESVYYQSDLKIVCNGACPEKCNTIEYKLNTQYSTYPDTSRVIFLFNSRFIESVGDLTLEQKEYIAERRMISIAVNYENLYYTLVSENPSITAEALLGTIGGNLGLFIGISFLSVIELIELVLESLYLYVKNKKKSSKQLSTKPQEQTRVV